MLFPIRLDDTVLHTPSGWAAQLRTRHIGDFQGYSVAGAPLCIHTRERCGVTPTMTGWSALCI